MAERFVVAERPENIGIWLLFDTEEKRCYPFTGKNHPDKAKALIEAKDPLVKRLGTVDYEENWETVFGTQKVWAYTELVEELTEENK